MGDYFGLVYSGYQETKQRLEASVSFDRCCKVESHQGGSWCMYKKNFGGKRQAPDSS